MKSIKLKSDYCRTIILFTILVVLLNGCGQIETLRNGAPKINSFNVPEQVQYGETVKFKVSVFDPEDDELTYSWDVSGGILKSDTAAEVEWIAPALPEEEVVPPQTVTVHVSVRDDGEEQASESATIIVSSKAYEVANALKGFYELVRTQINGETVESLGGTMRLTTTTFTRQFEEGTQFFSGSYQLVEPYNDKKGIINWFPDGILQLSVSTYTWDGKLLIIYSAPTSTTHVYEKKGDNS
ncbi:MAG: hypothetical protein OXI43_17405 [Candidatus Poribacteria bacterium]|nr:hypothetical protein [Candidatus Poribacteria bacterium]